jgi:hypothetical protein
MALLTWIKDNEPDDLRTMLPKTAISREFGSGASSGVKQNPDYRGAPGDKPDNRKPKQEIVLLLQGWMTTPFCGARLPRHGKRLANSEVPVLLSQDKDLGIAAKSFPPLNDIELAADARFPVCLQETTQ